MDNEAEVAQAATTEAVVSQETASEATENTEGQVENQPAEASVETDAKDKADKESRHDRRKAYEKKLRESEEAAKAEAARERSKVERILALTGEKPNESDFDDPLAFAAALGAYNYRQASTKTDASLHEDDAKAADTRATEAEQARMKSRVDAFEDQAKEARKTYPDFEQALAVAADPKFVSMGLSVMILESEQAADLAYHIGKNPALAVSLSQLPPIAAARELGRIEASISLPQPKTQTGAPEPITPTRGTGSARRSADAMSYDEYAKARRDGRI